LRFKADRKTPEVPLDIMKPPVSPVGDISEKILKASLHKCKKSPTQKSAITAYQNFGLRASQRAILFLI
jgi:hypothetical protein